MADQTAAKSGGLRGGVNHREGSMQGVSQGGGRLRGRKDRGTARTARTGNAAPLLILVLSEAVLVIVRTATMVRTERAANTLCSSSRLTRERGPIYFSTSIFVGQAFQPDNACQCGQSRCEQAR